MSGYAGAEAGRITTLSTNKGSPKYSFKGKGAEGRKPDTPGPGAYASVYSESTTKYNKSPQYGFGGASRDGNRASPAPGPGQYSPSDPSTVSTQYGFGTSSRKGGASRGDQPGPGAYNVGAQVGAEGPKYSASPRRDWVPDAVTPGPGTYQPPDPSAAGDKSSPKWGFGTSGREARARPTAANPGPGAYTSESKLAGPQYSMRGRVDPNRVAPTPGPGAHGPVYTQFG